MQVSSSIASKRPIRRREPGATATPTVDPRTALACHLDRNADALLFLGCHLAAERLSLRALALRQVAS